MMKSWSNGSFGDLTQPSMPQGMRGEEWMGSPERFCSPREGALRGGVPLQTTVSCICWRGAGPEGGKACRPSGTL